jgi:molecular chaperone DnaK (HSP70)
VAFGKQARMLGKQAKVNQVSNIQNTVLDCKGFLGIPFEESRVMQLLNASCMVVKTEAVKEGGIGFQVYISIITTLRRHKSYALSL